MQVSVDTISARGMQLLLLACSSCHQVAGRCRRDLQAALTVPLLARVVVLSAWIYCDRWIYAGRVQAWLMLATSHFGKLRLGLRVTHNLPSTPDKEREAWDTLVNVKLRSLASAAVLCM